MSSLSNPLRAQTLRSLANGKKYFDISHAGASVASLPMSIRVLLESAVRNCDDFAISQADVHNILQWSENQGKTETPFKPSRVVLQDFTGVPAVVDLAAMRSAMARLGADPSQINPRVPVDLVIDHSVAVDYYARPDAAEMNQELEMQRNKERFEFLKWGSQAFDNFRIVPPGTGIVHQVNLEYLARSVFELTAGDETIMFPDSLVGTDSHTTMINGLGIAGWGVGGIEAESVMLGQPVRMVLPEVVGFELSGRPDQFVTATDIVLTVTQKLREHGVIGKFVEFFGAGVQALSLEDRATLANMGPEYGATMGFFPVDARTLEFLGKTGKTQTQLADFEAYFRANNMFVSEEMYANPGQDKREFTSTLHLDLSTVRPSVAGPKRPQDRVAIADLPTEFSEGLTAPVDFKSFGLEKSQVAKEVKFDYEGEEYTLRNGDVVLTAITSCTNTSNPSVLMGAGIVAKKAVEKGLTVDKFRKTSLAPGSHVVTEYLEAANLTKPLEQLGFHTVGYGCTTCIGNSGDIPQVVEKAIEEGDLVVAGVLSGNRNFEGRVHTHTRANYLASPPLVVAYALAGRVDIDFEKEPIGQDKEGNNVFLRDIWPTRDEVADYCSKYVTKDMFDRVYDEATVEQRNAAWAELQAPTGNLYSWTEDSTYIHHPPFFQSMDASKPGIHSVKGARCLLNLGDSITTDHISPAGKIAKDSPAARYLQARGVSAKDFNSYGSRRGNDEVMARGTFANIRLINKMAECNGPFAKHVPSGEQMSVFDCAMKYQEDGTPLVILGGALYGNGSSRDWAAKGVSLQGVKVVVAKSFERIHRSNLIGMGVVPLQFLEGEGADELGLTGYSSQAPRVLIILLCVCAARRCSTSTLPTRRSRRLSRCSA
ncbi:MAG: hypothetical protein MHM6MM_001428 [Cercozoa sp. M6MM]